MKFCIVLVMFLVSGLLLSGCSKSEDSRFKLCKRVTQQLAGSAYAFEWHENKTNIKGPAYAQAIVNFTATGGDSDGSLMQSSCYFNHDQPEENAMDHAYPLAAYSTLPYRMTINGREVPEDMLNKAVAEEQIKPIRDFLQKGKSAIDGAINAQ